MRQNCKKILLSIIIGILVMSLSFLSLVGCDIMKSATSSPEDGNTTIDNGKGASQSDGKDATPTQQTDKTDTDNPSTDTPNGDAHSAIGGGETNSTQSGEGNEDADPNGNSGNTTEGNGENGNTPNSGNENGDDNGNSGDNGNENPNQDDPTSDDPQPEELDFSGLEAKLEEIAAQVQRGASLNELISFSENQGDLYFIADITRAGNKRIIVYKVEERGELSSQEVINGVTESLTKNDFVEVATLRKTSTDITVDGVTYSKDGIEGDNPFARQCGVENAWMTYVSDIGKPVLNPNSSTNYFSGYQVLVVFLQEGEIFIRNQPINVECEKGYSEQEILEASFSGEKYVGGELQLSEFINLGKSLINSQIAEASD